MKICPKCSLESGDDQKFCPACGTNLQSDLEKFLEAQGISQLAGAMKAHDITSLEVLKELGENDISELGLAYGDKVRIKVAIESLKRPEAPAPVQNTAPGHIDSEDTAPQSLPTSSGVPAQSNVDISTEGSGTPSNLTTVSGAVSAQTVAPNPGGSSTNPNPSRQGSAGNVIASLCSLIFPGLGQLIQGRVGAAIGFFIGSGVLWCIFLGWIMHIWACVNAANWKPKA